MSLTPLQAEVLKLSRAGLSQAAIARKVETTSGHVRSILASAERKIESGLTRRTQTFRLTSRQSEILEFIKQNVVDRGYAPSIREICRRFAIRSTNGVNDHLLALERKNYIRRDLLKSRAIVVNGLETSVSPRLRGKPSHTVEWLVPHDERP